MPGSGEGLDRAQFAHALRLVALAQSGDAAASGAPAALPRLAPQGGRPAQRACGPGASVIGVLLAKSGMH